LNSSRTKKKDIKVELENMASLKNGLLIVTCLSKLQQSLSLANKKVVENLYIHYHPQEPQKFENLSKVKKIKKSEKNHAT
jgi:hypothetical protein